MINITKYINYNHLIKVLSVLFFITGQLYVYPQEFVTSNKPTVNSDIYKFNIGYTNCYSIHHNNQNIIYICTDEGLLIYNGNTWNLQSMIGKTFDALPYNNALFLLTQNSFGVINTESSANNKFQKINSGTDTLKPDINDKIFTSGNYVFLFSGSSLYQINKLQLFKVQNSIKSVFQGNQGLFLLNNQNQLYLLSDNKQVQNVFVAQLDSNSTITNIFEWNGETYIFLEKGGKADIEILNKNTKGLEPYLIMPGIDLNDIIKVFPVDQNNWLFITKSKKIILYNPISPSADEIGLTYPFKTELKSVDRDVNNNIWLLYNDGVVRLNFENYSRVLPYPEMFGADNQLLFGKKLAYSVDKNLFITDFGEGLEKFETQTPVIALSAIDSNLIIACQDQIGVYSPQKKYEKIIQGTIAFFQPQEDSGKQGFYAVVNRNLIFAENSGNEWKAKTICWGIPAEINEILQISDQEFNFINKAGELKSIKKGRISKSAIAQVTSENGNLLPWKGIMKFNNHIFLQNSLHIYEITPPSKLRPLPFTDQLTNQKLHIENFYLNPDNSAWVNCRLIGETLMSIYFVKNIDSCKSSNIINIPYKHYGISDVFKISPKSSKELAIVGNNKILFFNIDGFITDARPSKVLITKFLINNDSAIYQPEFGIYTQPQKLKLNYGTQNIKLEFTSTDYKSGKNISYSYLLSGFDKVWSPWQANPYKTFSNLPSGKYIFKIRARSDNGEISDESSFLFVIKTPLYLRGGAFFLYAVIIIIIISIYWLKRRRDFEVEKQNLENIINERTSELQREKEKTDELLANLLPRDTANELKNTGKATSQKYEMVTVLFSDIEGFTKIAEQMNPEKLIDELDNFFFHFDSVVEKYNIEKIKTIGDAYMCAGGIPYKNRTNPVEVVLAALEMQEYMRQLKQKNAQIWDLRIGVHTGAVIAGVVGHKRISYDIWGDTVNTASRMESSGEAGKINISGHTYDLVKDFFICEYRGKMPVKYKGDVDMYFVKGIRPELSIDLKVIPNKRFFIQLQLLRLHDIEEFILNKLRDELPHDLYFHNAKHTKDVYTQTELLGRAEELSQEEMLIVRTAALFTDIGYINDYHNHIQESVVAAREILPKFKYSEIQIETICNLIYSIGNPDSAKNKLEFILIDSLFDHYGRIDYLDTVVNRYNELKIRIPSVDISDWLSDEIRWVEKFEFYTETAKLLREIPAQKQIQKIKEYSKFS